MDCSLINEPVFLNKEFINAQDEQLNQIFKCFFKQYYGDFKRYAKNRFNVKEDTWIYDAFTDGLLSFYFTLKRKGFEEKKSSIKTIVFKFCTWKLIDIIKKKAEDNRGVISIDSENEKIVLSEILPADDAIEKWDKLEKAFSKLGEKCRNLLKWRKLDKLSNEEIAKRAGIEAISVNNEIYKCFKKLKALI